MSHCLASSAAASASGFHDQVSADRIRRSRVSSNGFRHYKQPSARSLRPTRAGRASADARLKRFALISAVGLTYPIRTNKTCHSVIKRKKTLKWQRKRKEVLKTANESYDLVVLCDNCSELKRRKHRSDALGWQRLHEKEKPSHDV